MEEPGVTLGNSGRLVSMSAKEKGVGSHAPGVEREAGTAGDTAPTVARTRPATRPRSDARSRSVAGAPLRERRVGRGHALDREGSDGDEGGLDRPRSKG